MTDSAFSLEYKWLIHLLIEARKQKGLTQTEVAARLGKGQSFVSKYERGQRRLDFIEVLNITDALEIDPHYVVTSVVAYRAKVKTKVHSTRPPSAKHRRTTNER